MEVGRTDEEIDSMMNEIADDWDRGHRRFSGMSYGDGIKAAIDWLRGDSDDHPYPDE